MDFQMQMTLDNGGIYPAPYPWVAKSVLVLDDILISSIKEEFTMASTNLSWLSRDYTNVM